MGIISSIFGSLYNSKPAVNIDGAIMVGDIDINGNFYGVTQSDQSVGREFLHD